MLFRVFIHENFHLNQTMKCRILSRKSIRTKFRGELVWLQREISLLYNSGLLNLLFRVCGSLQIIQSQGPFSSSISITTSTTKPCRKYFLYHFIISLSPEKSISLEVFCYASQIQILTLFSPFISLIWFWN